FYQTLSNNHRIPYQGIPLIRSDKESIPYYLHRYPWYCGCYGKGEYQLSFTVRKSTVYRQGRQGRQKTGIQKAGGGES
ncbi:hypothetical protein, partial [Phocaeicola sp.]|uniref:hypothetical protein n=1 Tax=Phocaeicola sp. TaxID=2773926 RepID=UPI003AF13F81